MKITQPRTDLPPIIGGDLSGGSGGSGGTITVTGIQGVPVCVTAPTLDDVLTFDGAEWCPAPLPAIPPGGNVSGQIVLGWDAGSFLLSGGSKSIPIEAPFDGTITGWSVFADGGIAGAAVVDIWKRVAGSYPPTVSDSICNIGGGGVKPTLSATDHALGGSVAHWTTAITAGDVFMAHLDSVTSFGKVEVVLAYSRP